jgi:peroxiredoxin
LQALQQVLEEIQKMGASLVALSPELPTTAQVTVEKNGLTFRVLSDEGNRVARQFGLVFDLPEDLKEFYKALGIDLPASNGDGTWRLPLPATYLIDRDRIIRDVFVNTDYVKRMEPDDIVARLRALNSP